MNSKSLVSVIITNYNYGQFLPAAIESVLAQSYPNIEIIVVDDGSTDYSHAVLQQYGEFIKPIFQAHAGQVAGFNAGYASSKGHIIAFLDADDTFLPGKVARLVQVFDTFPDAGWCFHRLKVIDSVGETLRLTPQLPDGLVDFRSQLSRGKVIRGFSSTSSLSFRRSVLEKIFPMPVLDEDRGVFIDDGYLKTLALGLSPGYSINESLGTLQLHGRNRQSGRSTALSQATKRNMWLAYLLVSGYPQFSKYSIIFASRALGRGWRIGWRYSSHERGVLLVYWKNLGFLDRFILIFRSLATFLHDILFSSVKSQGA